MERFFCKTKKVAVIMILILMLGMCLAPIVQAGERKVGTITIQLGQEYRLTPYDGLWDSKDTSIVTVKNGWLKGNKIGKTKIVYKFYNNPLDLKIAQRLGLETEVTFEVIVKDVRLNRQNLTLQKGQEWWMSAYDVETGEQIKDVKFVSDNPNVVKMQGAKAIGVKTGTATITGTTKDGMKATCKVKVEQVGVQPNVVTLSKTNIKLKAGQEYWLTATIQPANAKNKNINWESNNTNVATVKAGKVIAKKAGTAIITATTINGKKAKCLVTVEEININKDVRLNRNEITLYKGQEWWMSAYDVKTGNQIKDVIFTSNNPDIVKMQGAKAIGVKKGTAVITGTTKDGKLATCKITVNDVFGSI